jgi:hypothetical protein
MRETEERLRVLLDDKARDMIMDAQMPARVARRASGRRLATAGVGALAAVASVVAVVVALTAVDDRSAPPVTSPTEAEPSPGFAGIWPQDSLVEAEAAQAAADAGDPDAIWQLDVVEVLRRYAREELGFDRVFFDESLDVDDASNGPHTIHVLSCEPRDPLEWPPVCAERSGSATSITVERLVKPGQGSIGIWSVTAAAPILSAGPGSGMVDPPGSYPSAFVGVTEDRDVVLASAADGSVVTVLATAEELGGNNLNLDLELAPDGTVVYVGARRSDSEASLYRVFVDGHDPVRIAEGYAAAVTDEHGLIAYAGCDEDGCGTTLVVASLENLDERTVLDVAPTIEARLSRIEWLADGRLAYSLWNPGDSNPQVRVIDPLTEKRPLEDVPAVGPDSFLAGWTPLGAYVDPQLLVVASYCCTGAAGDEIERERVLVVDPVSGQSHGTLYEGAGLEAIDRSGRFLLIIRFDQGGADLGTWVLEADGSLRRIGEGYDQVAW